MLFVIVIGNDHVNNYVPYSLKISRVKIFMDFMKFGVPTKIVALKILSCSIVQCSTSNFIHKTAKFTIP